MMNLKKYSLAFAVPAAIVLLASGFIAYNTLFSPAGGNTNPEGLKNIVPFDKIVSGGPAKDVIPSIDNPVFLEPDEAEFLSDTDVVVGIHYNDVAKAYPLEILVWHEIVNDWYGATPVVVTYCPLCYSSIAYIRELDGKPVEFGTSGRLYKNDLVMYDRQQGNNQLTVLGSDLTNAGNLWSQMLGQAIVGDLAGQKLDQISADVMRWDDWRELHPETLVLSTQTGHSRAYGTDPYGDYYTTEGTLFPIENADNRFPQKEVVIGVEYNERYKAYPVRTISENQVLSDVFQDKGLVFFQVGDNAVRVFESDVDGQRLAFEYRNGLLTDKQTESVWNEHGQSVNGPLTGKRLDRAQAHTAFWFAWADFYPETEVYE
jgi:hypothetical protein